MPASFEPLLPDVRVPPPGPRSRALAARLRQVECPDTTYLADDFPVFWERAAGANVWDVDGNRYVDLTAAFGVACPGHGHPAVAAALREQSGRLVHGMGDVHPSELKVQVGEALAAIAPGELGVSLFGNAGFEAVEAAIKTSALVTGRPGVVAFEGGYHGLGYGALAATWRDDFRAPFRAQLGTHVTHLPFPDPRRRVLGGRDAADEAARVLDRLDTLLSRAEGSHVGAVLVEPIQGRAGVVVPDPSFLVGLRELCSRRRVLLVCDEILTGLGRTGRWFACEHSGVVPDLLCVGKALGGGLPLSACIGSPEIMAAWGPSRGEARHTTTHLGNPLACAAGLAVLATLEREGWIEAVDAAGAKLGDALGTLAGIPGVDDVRGIGLLWGVELRSPSGDPDRRRTFDVVRGALGRGVLLLGDGTEHNVLAFTPPFVLAAAQRDSAVGLVREVLEETASP